LAGIPFPIGIAKRLRSYKDEITFVLEKNPKHEEYSFRLYQGFICRMPTDVRSLPSPMDILTRAFGKFMVDRIPDGVDPRFIYQLPSLPPVTAPIKRGRGRRAVPY
jgi:hypothetical protein